MDTAVVGDHRAQATSASGRLRLIGERVGLAAHGQSAALFEMVEDLSRLLHALEGGLVSTPSNAWQLYLEAPPLGSEPSLRGPIGALSRRVITEWATATGKDLKVRRGSA